MVGIAGSGKTTYANSRFPDYVHVSLDTNRKSLPLVVRRRLIQRYDRERPLDLVNISSNRKVECVQMDDTLKDNRSVVVDDTSLTREVRRPYVELAQKHGAAIRAVFFTNVEQAYVWNEGRANKPDEDMVPKHVLDEQCERLEPPTKNEGFGSIQTFL